MFKILKFNKSILKKTTWKEVQRICIKQDVQDPSYCTYMNWRNGKSEPNISQAYALKDALNLDFMQLTK